MSVPRFTEADVRAAVDEAHQSRYARTGRWWRYAVLRSDGNTSLPASEVGKWYDLDEIAEEGPHLAVGTKLVATDRWEMREDGEVAVVYIPRGLR